MAKKKQTVTLDEDQRKTLREHCEETGLKISTVVGKGIDLYFKQIEKEKQK
jgi:hypothetical protein